MASVSLEDIQAEALAEGFLLAGICAPRQPAHYDTFEGWLSKGLHADMDWIARDYSRRLRKDPSLLLDGCRSVVMLVIPYPFPDDESLTPGFGHLAAYACVEDYHTTLPPRLKSLAKRITAVAGKPARIKVFTDSSPIMERDLAMASGLGWIGKNTCLISPTAGSFFFLAELLMDIDLPFSDPFKADRCGTCRICIDACPTGCIREDRTIDSRRCISYLTIEHKGAIPQEIRPILGEWLFGCDVCQKVCPWNQKKVKNDPGSIFPVDRLSGKNDLRRELDISEAMFSEKYTGYPVSRTGFERYQRNLVVCAGNSACEELIPQLGKILSSNPSALVRSHAAWALGCYHTRLSSEYLDRAKIIEPDPTVTVEIHQAFAK